MTKPLQEYINPPPQHADYLPDMTATREDAESDYEQEEDDQGPEEDYDDYHQNNNQMD